eukprot:TRINITY_DN2020_c0_g1_i3.p1 TRINITY_DN2020_c0_g1~~TRINITY_DN2020_c0_g1_i3.p1  ORF type:complete len:552 (+),score=125.26 TRINITY_DN2020_c0_g1_i3:279-1934(+)
MMMMNTRHLDPQQSHWQTVINECLVVSDQVVNAINQAPRNTRPFALALTDAECGEVRSTVVFAKTCLSPFVNEPYTASIPGLSVDPTFGVSINGIVDGLAYMLDWFSKVSTGSNAPFSVEEFDSWKTRKMALFQMDFTLRQKSDQLVALYTLDVKYEVITAAGSRIIADEEGQAWWRATFGDTCCGVTWTRFLSSYGQTQNPMILSATPSSPGPATETNYAPVVDVQPTNYLAAPNPDDSTPPSSSSSSSSMLRTPIGDGNIPTLSSSVSGTGALSEPQYFTPADEEQIRNVIDCTRDDFVTTWEFGVFLKLFGPLSGSSERLLDALRSGILCGFVPGIEANMLLEGKPEGFYIIRFSKTQPGSFAVTFVDHSAQVKHCLLHSVTPGPGLTLRSPPTVFKSLQDFIKGHKAKLRFPITAQERLKSAGVGDATASIFPSSTPASPAQQRQYPLATPWLATPNSNNNNNNGSPVITPGDGLSSPVSSVPITPTSPAPPRKEDRELCHICMDNRINTVFLECGHLSCCSVCAKPLTLCPICRAPITRVVPVFMP